VRASQLILTWALVYRQEPESEAKANQEECARFSAKGVNFDVGNNTMKLDVLFGSICMELIQGSKQVKIPPDIMVPVAEDGDLKLVRFSANGNCLSFGTNRETLAVPPKLGVPHLPSQMRTAFGPTCCVRPEHCKTVLCCYPFNHIFWHLLQKTQIWFRNFALFGFLERSKFIQP
jgi:hypothetical protein